MSGVNAHAIIRGAEAAAPAAAIPWQRSLRCFVDVLVAGYPLLGVAAKVRQGACAYRGYSLQ